MPLRHAHWRDLPTAATLSSSAFKNEHLLSFIHPNRHLHPTGPALWFLKNLRHDFFDPCATILVSHPSGLPNLITGVAVWIRKGPLGEEPLKARQSLWGRLCCAIVIPVLNFLEEVFWPNRAAEPSRVDVLERGWPMIKHHWETLDPPRVENWFLHLLATGPEWQGRGFGRELVGWGLGNARREGVAASVISAKGKERFYERCGFGATIVGWACEGEGNPMAGVEGGAILWMDVERGEEEEEEGEGRKEGGLVEVREI